MAIWINKGDGLHEREDGLRLDWGPALNPEAPRKSKRALICSERDLTEQECAKLVDLWDFVSEDRREAARKHQEDRKPFPDTPEILKRTYDRFSVETTLPLVAVQWFVDETLPVEHPIEIPEGATGKLFQVLARFTGDLPLAGEMTAAIVEVLREVTAEESRDGS